MVSVIMAAYNHRLFVEKAVTTVLEQTLGDLELIVADDGSSDGTPDIVASIGDPRIKLLRLTSNRATHPRNLALMHARGRYVAFQNSDDAWQPAKLAQQVHEMEKQAGLSACFTAAELIDETGQPSTGTWADNLFTTEERSQAEWLRHFFDVGNCLLLPSALVRRSHLTAIGGFRASLVQLGDFDLWIRLAMLGQFRLLPETLTHMRIVSNTNLSAPSPATVRRSQLEHAVVLERYLEKPFLRMLDSVFPDLSGLKTTGARKVAVAQRALRLGGVGALFADRAIAGVMDKAQERADATAEHGAAFIHEFLARRGAWAFVQDIAGDSTC